MINDMWLCMHKVYKSNSIHSVYYTQHAHTQTVFFRISKNLIFNRKNSNEDIKIISKF